MQSPSVSEFLLRRGFRVDGERNTDIYLFSRIMVFVYPRYACASIEGFTPTQSRIVSGPIRDAEEIANFCNSLAAEIDHISGEE